MTHITLASYNSRIHALCIHVGVFRRIKRERFRIQPALFTAGRQQRQQGQCSDDIFLFVVLHILSSLSKSEIKTYIIRSHAIKPIVTILFRGFDIEIIPTGYGERVTCRKGNAHILHFEFLQEILGYCI